MNKSRDKKEVGCRVEESLIEYKKYEEWIENIESFLGITDKFDEYDEYSINENIEINKRDEFQQSIEEYHQIKLEDEEELIARDKEYRIKARDKVNNLRILRIEDLDNLRQIRIDKGEDFTEYMKTQYIFLCSQFIANYNNIYLDNCKRSKVHFNDYSDEIERNMPCYYTCKIYFDCRKILNQKLIDRFKITMEEQQQMKLIISEEEKKRRKNLKRRQNRRDSNGLTKREKGKQDNENKIKILKHFNPDIKMSEVASIMNLHISTISRVYGHLF